MAAPETPQVTAQSPGAARVWFLRTAGANSYALGAAPMIYANGTAVADIPANVGFYRDFAPGTYRFTVQPYGSPNNKADTVRLVRWTPIVGQPEPSPKV